MLSLKPVVYQGYLRRDGQFPIKIRVTFQRRSRYFDTALVATRQQLTRNLDGIRDYRLCSAVCRVVDQWRDLLNQNAHTISDIADVVRIISAQKRELPTVADYGRMLADQMQADRREHTAANYRTAVQRLSEFAPGCQFSDVTVPWLRRFEQWLATRMGARGVQLYMSCVRKIYNAALDEFNADGVERIRRSPFEHYKIPEPPATRKRALTVAQLQMIAAYQTTDPIAQLGRDVFLLSFCFCGINTVDLYSLDGLEAGRLTYNRSKTKAKRRDGAALSIAVHPLAADLVARYADGRRFRFRQQYNCAYNFNRAVNKGLKRIGAAIDADGLQFYAARHSWATIARNECDVSMDDVAMALCHSRRTVTDIYIKSDFARVDVANDRVLRYCFSKI